LSSPTIPTADQLAAARRAHWRHNADPILTVNMLRDWLNASGLVLHTARPAHLPVPAPTFIEVTLGAPNSAPTLAETEQSRTLLSRLVLDGGAIPLNLLGNPTGIGTETPDFLVSPLAFPYVFTLRGDKAWKQPPTTSGASKVSPLALNTYTLLTERAAEDRDKTTRAAGMTAPGLSAYDLATQLGKEVTETAVLRALTELWQQLRVIPVPQPDGAATLWELTSTRFTKQIKAGANAGQPSALSALISLYLAQAIVASEEEIETFLSPLAARSRIREVVHALVSARQLETVVIEGRPVLHVAGELPAFATVAEPAHDDIDFLVVTSEGDATPETSESAEPKARITKFVPKPRKVGTGFVTKPGRNSEDKPADRERRPFKRDASRPPFEKKFERKSTFTKPWEEEKTARLSAAQRPSRTQDEGEAAPHSEKPRTFDRKPAANREGKRPFSGSKPFDRKPSFDRKPAFGSKPRFGSKPGFGDRPSFKTDRPSFKSDRPSSSDRPPFRKDRPTFRREDSGDSRPPRREFTPRPYNKDSGDAGERPRKTFSKPGTFGRKREGFAGKPAFQRDGESRPPRRDFADKPFVRRDRDERAPRRDFGDRPKRAEGRTDGPPFRKFDAPRKPRPFSSDRPDRPARAESSGSFADKPRKSFGAKKPFDKAGKTFAGKPSGSFAKRPGSFAGKKPYGKSAAGTPGKPAGTFDKFKGNKKPFGKRAPARKFKPKEDE
jgi:23S rRNA pseudouridine2605 synthase